METTAPAKTPAALTLLRVAVLAHLAMILWEGATAGNLVTTPISMEALYLHYYGAFVVHAAAAVQLGAAAWLWWGPGRARTGARALLVISALALLLGLVQAALGTFGVLQAHVPLAVVLTGLVAWSAALAWRR
ncbi:hypothetical protein IDM40_13400 [Nocardiopsis sp. HNM0947]|uniref:DUF423 domain-containing protein n=1 Tax=Nocardiopsis coralli TaxID=2772213 RepID=A0ABR9P770_9ACTN|nr:hypothetical protein [Nocardiopsis coralli]MBE2999697.1 hypothetical protein [Nocardiopsis coralli]